MAIAVGTVVRPLLQYLQRSGQLFDWAGVKSAQGYVRTNLGTLGTTGANYWNRNTSALVAAPSYGGIAYYTVVVWDSNAQAFVSLTYPEAELQAGIVGALPITSIFPLPTNPAPPYGSQLFNLCTSRT